MSLFGRGNDSVRTRCWLPDQSVVKLDVGDWAKLTGVQFEASLEGVFAEIESKSV